MTKITLAPAGMSSVRRHSVNGSSPAQRYSVLTRFTTASHYRSALLYYFLARLLTAVLFARHVSSFKSRPARLYHPVGLSNLLASAAAAPDDFQAEGMNGPGLMAFRRMYPDGRSAFRMSPERRSLTVVASLRVPSWFETHGFRYLFHPVRLITSIFVVLVDSLPLSMQQLRRLCF